MRIASTLSLAALLLMLGVGCGLNTVREASKKVSTTTVTTSDGAAKESAPVDAGAMPEAPGEVSATPGFEAKSEPKGKSDVAAPTTPPAIADPVVGTAKAKPKKLPEETVPAGILTAGSFDDNLDPLVFSSFTKRVGQIPALGDLPRKLAGHRLMILVKDGGNKPVGGARVKLASGTAPGAEVFTRSDGRAVFILSWDQLPSDQPLLATVTPPDGGAAVTEPIMAGAPRWEITLPLTQARMPKNLDLAILLDTTGSMGDEHRFLASEIRGIAETIKKKFPEIKQRFALICYRDDGDEYVTRPFDFTAGLDEFHRNLQAQRAGGGGDYPEAVHKGIEEVNQLRWKESDTASVLFWVADAPPHAQHMNRAMNAVNNLRKKGVAIYPVACSGYEDQTEFVMRSTAVLTGSQFLFLTDDSGVGSSHAEPKIPYYQVERLNRLMIRMIESEIIGQRVEAGPGDVIRTVGRKVN